MPWLELLLWELLLQENELVSVDALPSAGSAL